MMFAVARITLRRSTHNVLLPRRAIAPLTVRSLATSTSWLDVTQEIKIDHDNVRELFERYKEAKSLEEKTIIANTLVREMSIHGDAEEISVYNDYTGIGLGDVAAHNKAEHADLKRLVWKAEHAFARDEDYDRVLADAVEAFVQHATEEEVEQLPRLRRGLAPERNDQVARAFLKARNSVPLRPHPFAPQTGDFLQKGMGLHGRIQDRLVEGVQGRKYVELKFKHADPEV